MGDGAEMLLKDRLNTKPSIICPASLRNYEIIRFIFSRNPSDTVCDWLRHSADIGHKCSA